MRICFLIATMSPGGAERVASVLCNAWAAGGHEVHLLTYAGPDDPVHYPLADSVVHHRLDLLKASESVLTVASANLKRLQRIRNTLTEVRPDILVSFMTECNVIAIGAARSLNVPVVVSERIHPGHHAIGRARSLARRLAYPFANAVVVQTNEIAQWCHEELGLETQIIPNPIDLTCYPRLSIRESSEQTRLIAVGRLVPQKGFDILIQAFARLRQSYPSTELVIFGDGPDRAELQRLIQKNGLEDRVRLPGTTDSIQAELNSSDIYVHPARYEGYPNALVEALASSLCCVATDCPGASAELLGDGQYGLLVANEDIEGLSNALATVIGDPVYRRAYAERARLAVGSLDTPQIAERWLTLFSQLTSIKLETRLSNHRENAGS